MKSFKLAGILLCLALISDQSHAVLNKNTKNINNENHVNDKSTEKNAEDRISNDYGPPRPSFNGPAPVYGPPELTGNHGPVQVFPPPPPELPPPPPPPLSQNFPGPRPSHPSYGPPSRKPSPLQLAPRPNKPSQWKLPPASSHFPGKSSPHGPPLPASLEAYGPPNNQPSPSFLTSSKNDYRSPAPLPPIPQPPPPGVRAPPTPPDIKYDGWQPIAGHIDNPNVNPRQLPNAPNHEATVNYPSDSYGQPIDNPEHHNLKQSIGQNSEQGLPPPILPDAEPLHNIQEPIKDSPTHLNVLESLPTASGLVTSFNDLPRGNDNSHGNIKDHIFLQPLTPPVQSVSNSYGAPPKVSFNSGHFSSSHASSNGLSQGVPFTAVNGLSFPLGFNTNTYRQNRLNSFNVHHYPRGPVPSRSHHGLSNSLIPPKSRAPIKFRESIPVGLFNSINNYLPPSSIHNSPNKQINTYGAPPRFSLNHQQPPALSQSPSFHSNVQSTAGFGSFRTSGTALDKSPLAAPNVNYGIPLTFTNLNTPSLVLTYGAPNFVSANSFTSNIARGNLYDQHTPLSTSYGSPSSLAQSQLFNGRQCSGYHKPIEIPISLPTLHHQAPDSVKSLQTNSEYSLPSINELALEIDESNENRSNLKDSYGNPTGSIGYDQRSASTVTHTNSQTILNGATAEALTADLTEQGLHQTSESYNQQSAASYNQDTNNIPSTNSLNVKQLMELQNDREPALALAQTLSAEGASSDGFQIQGSEGIYTLQIQSSDGLHENSDGSIRHDQLLSNGLLQDILAAIEEPGDGKNQLVEIQGMPQAQQLHEIHEQTYSQNNEHDEGDFNRPEASSIVTVTSIPDSKISANHQDVALFFNNNYENDLTKDVRSTAKSEGSIESSTKVSEEKSRVEST